MKCTHCEKTLHGNKNKRYCNPNCYSKHQWVLETARNHEYQNLSDEDKADVLEDLRLDIMRGINEMR